MDGLPLAGGDAARWFLTGGEGLWFLGGGEAGLWFLEAGEAALRFLAAGDTALCLTGRRGSAGIEIGCSSSADTGSGRDVDGRGGELSAKSVF